MYQTVEAVVRNGRIEPAEPIEMHENDRFLLVRLEPRPEAAHPKGDFRASRGKFRGRLSSVDGFMATKADEKGLER